MSPRTILERILPYVPPYWLRQALIDPEHTLVGREACFRAAVLFVDISGFTPTTETLSKKGPEGMEQLSRMLDRYFDAMSGPVVALGGEVFKFAGDSLIVLFLADHDDLYLGAALECAMRMQRAVLRLAGGELNTLAGPFSLQIKVGISEGPVYTTTVGDEAGGMQPVLAGRALVRAIQAERVAEPGEVLVDAMLTSRLPGRLDIREARGTFRLISDVRNVPLLPVAPELDLSSCESERAALLVQRLKPYLAAHVWECIEQTDRSILCEHRCVTTMFVRFDGLELDRMTPGCAGSGGPVSLSRDGSVLQDYVVAMRDCIRQYGGRLNEVDFTAQGGTLVVFFGAPIAQEDDEVSAVACAWEMRRVLGNLWTDWDAPPGSLDVPGVRQCVSISSGTVFVGDVGARVRRIYAVVGDGVNLAARLAGLAQWGEILVTDPVRRAAKERFVFAPLGEREIRGKTERVPLAVLVEPRQQGHSDTPLSRLLLHGWPVGRASEVAVLDDVRERAWRGVPQWVQIVGQAGMGKSCLAGQLADRWLVHGGRVLVGEDRFAEHGSRQKAQAGQPGCYALWLALLRCALNVQKADSRAQQQQRIRQELASLALPAEQASMLRSFVLANATARRGLAADRQRLCQAVRSLFDAASVRRPLLVVLEDLDCVDDASLDLLRDVLCDWPRARNCGSALLFCVTGRPTGECDLWERPDSRDSLDRDCTLPFESTRVILEPLSEHDSQALAVQFLQDAGLECDVLPSLLWHGGGNPFFIRELIQEWVDGRTRMNVSGDPRVAHVRDRTSDDALSAVHPIPARVAHAVLAQLDPLNEELKYTLRLAAVLGQSFSFSVLHAAHPGSLSVSALAQRLAVLERMHIVRLAHVGESNPASGEVSSVSRKAAEDASTDPPNVHYRFRHAITQQVLYASLVHTDLERFHRAVGYAIQDVYRSDLDTQYERLAEHFCRGKVLVPAVVYSMLAGRDAVKARAVREALVYYDWADEMLCEHLQAGRSDHLAWPSRETEAAGVHREVCSAYLCVQGVQLALMLERSRVLLYLMEIPRAKADLEQAVSLAGDLADLGLQGKALLALAEILYHEAEYGEAMAVVRRALQCFAALGDQRRQARAWKLQSRIHAALGQSVVALQCVGRAGGTSYGCYLGSVYFQPSAVHADSEGDLYSLQASTTDWSVTIEKPMWLALVSAYRGEWGRALLLARDGIAAGWALGTPLDMADAKWVLACVLTRIGAFAEANGHLDEAMAAYVEAGWRRGQIAGLALRGQGRIGLGQDREAAFCFEQALAYATETHSVPGVVDAQVGLGRLSAISRQWCRAERWCAEARARAQQARLGVARVEAQVSLAHVYLAQERWESARVQAAQAWGSSRSAGFRDLVMESADLLGQAWLGLGEPGRARACFEESDAVARQLSETLPPAYVGLFVRRGRWE